MSETTKPYFDAMQEFDWAMTERKFPQALAALRNGLRHSLSALRSMKDEWGSIPQVPFVGTKAGALAALTNDEESFRLMEEVADFIGEDSAAQVRKFREDALAIIQIRDLLKSKSAVSLIEVKQSVDPDVRSRITRLISWMEKNAELSVEKSGNSTTITLGPAARKGRLVAPTFRDQSPLVVPPRRWFPHLARDRSRPKASGKAGQVPLPLNQSPLAPSERLPGVMQTHALRDGFWLIGHSRTLPNGAGETKVVAKSKSGETLKSFVLPYRVVRAFSNLRREHIVILDSTLTVVVLDLTGSTILEFALWGNPEVRSVLDALDDSTKATAALRSVDVSPSSGDIAFSVIDRLWRFTSEGHPVSALQVQMGDPAETTDAVVLQAGTEITLREIGKGVWNRDWIYYLRFSEKDDSLLVSTYAGNLLRLSSDGNIESHWDVLGAANDIVELDNEVIVSTRLGTSFLDRDRVTKYYPDNDGTFFTEALLVRGTQLFNPITQTGVEYGTPGEVRGVYPVNGKLRVEFKTSFCDVDFP